MAYTAPMTGFLNVRLTGARKADWDLALFDRDSRRLLASSQAFSASELAQIWVTAGQRIVVQGCRRSGSGRAARASVQLVDLKRSAGGTPQLLSVETDNAGLARLERLGVDVTHQIHDGHADVIVSGAKQKRLLSEAGFTFRTEVADLNEHFVKSRMADLEFTRRVRGKSALPSGR